MSNSPYFTHWRGSPDIAPFLSYLVELCQIKFSGLHSCSMDTLCHEGIEICYIIKGSHTWRVEDKIYQLYPGDGFIISPWQRSGSSCVRHERGVVAWIVIRPELFDSQGSLKLGDWSRLMKKTQDHIGQLFADNKSALIHKAEVLQPFFKSLDDELVLKQTGYEERINLMLDSILLEVARLLERPQSEVSHDDEWMKALQEKMESWLVDQRVTMDKMAYSFGMCQSTFERKVKTTTGYTPSEFFSKLKLDKAQKLLIYSDLSIKGIALQSGFSSSQYFAVSFAKWVGESPTAFRERMKRKQISSALPAVY